MTEPTSDLVKRLEAITEHECEFYAVHVVKAADEAAARIRALEAEVGTWNANYNKQVYKNLTDMVALRADADRRVAEEREACAKIAETTWFEATDTDWDIGVNDAKRQIASAIRSRSNGAEPEFLSAAVKNHVLTARSQGASPISQEGSIAPEALSEGGE